MTLLCRIEKVFGLFLKLMMACTCTSTKVFEEFPPVICTSPRFQSNQVSSGCGRTHDFQHACVTKACLMLNDIHEYGHHEPVSPNKLIT